MKFIEYCRCNICEIIQVFIASNFLLIFNARKKILNFKNRKLKFYIFSGNLGTRFHITKYPTIKYVRNGEMAKREYRGQRSADSFVDFVREQNKDPVKEYQNLEELQEMDDTKRYLIGYFETKDSPEYNVFRKVASNLKDDCVVYAGFGEVSNSFMAPKICLFYNFLEALAVIFFKSSNL